jgi:hypothetical protein
VYLGNISKENKKQKVDLNNKSIIKSNIKLKSNKHKVEYDNQGILLNKSKLKKFSHLESKNKKRDIRNILNIRSETIKNNSKGK